MSFLLAAKISGSLVLLALPLWSGVEAAVAAYRRDWRSFRGAGSVAAIWTPLALLLLHIFWEFRP